MIDPDEGCTSSERSRRALVRAVDRIGQVWGRAVEDVDARGYPTGRSGIRASAENTTVEAAALQLCQALVWLGQVDHLSRQAVQVANLGLRLWPPPSRYGQTVDGVRIGARTSTVEMCAYCQLPVVPGQIRRVGPESVPVHRKPCWYNYRAGNPLQPIKTETPRTASL
jgi:hypothetical protein